MSNAWINNNNGLRIIKLSGSFAPIQAPVKPNNKALSLLPKGP